MRKLILVIGVLVGILGILIAYFSQGQSKHAWQIQVPAGIVVPKFPEPEKLCMNMLSFTFHLRTGSFHNRDFKNEP